MIGRVRFIFLFVIAGALGIFLLSRTTQEVTEPELYLCAYLGSEECQGWLGYRKEKAEKYEAAEYWYTKAANQGFASAQIALGTFYRRGLLEYNPSKAFYWYDLAIQSGRRDADLLLAYGQMLIQGDGVKKNFMKGMEWVSKAAFLRNLRAQLYMAQYYTSADEEVRKSIPQDPALAWAWLTVAKESVPQGTELYEAMAEEVEKLLPQMTDELMKESELQAELIKQNMLRAKIGLRDEKND